MYNRNTEIDMESVAAFLQDTVEKIRSEKNPEVLDELKKVFKNQLRINITLQYLGIPQIDFRWFWSSTLGSSPFAWRCYSGDGNWCGGFYSGHVDYCYYVLPFLELS